METRQELPQVSHLTHAELLELKAATTDQRVWYAVSRELAARAEHGGDWRTPVAETSNDPEPDRVTDPGAWFAWRHRMAIGAALIV